MDQMYEMYTSFSDKYERLISHEDYQNNLCILLKNCIDWKNKSVYEFGAGTGRVTSYYIDLVKSAAIYDSSESMLELAKNKLDYQNLSISQLDNTQIHTLEKQVDIVIEGWSFGHLVVEKKDELYLCLKYLDSNVKRLAREYVVIIETLGTNVNIPTVTNQSLNKMYSFLEENGYKKNIIRTDYKFESYNETAEIMGSFFGDKIKQEIIEKKLTLIPEYTGIWIFDVKNSSIKKNSKDKYLFNL